VQPAASSPALAAWNRFVHDGGLDLQALRPEIADSWRRCRASGVDPFAGRSAGVLARADLERLLDQHRNVIEVARPFMRTIQQFVASSSFVVLLCDEFGFVLETAGDPGLIALAEDLNFSPGALWSEREVGTNGTGTALVLQRPFQVSGPEHFCRKHHGWTCSGAPIFDEGGRVLAILEMSGPVEATHLHTLGMVVAAAEAIRQQLQVQSKNRELMLLNNHLGSLFQTVSDGVAVVDPQGLIQQVNPVAEKILAGRSQDLVGRSIHAWLERPRPLMQLLEDGRAFNDLEFHVGRGAQESNCLVSGKPVIDDQGHLARAVIFLNPSHRMNTLINRFSGAQASFTFDDILGGGEALDRAIRLGHRAAGSDSNVLLCGESGTGKEMFAHAIHARSDRHQGPFIAVNCGAIPRELIGSELFGYAEGAFTGAHKGGRPGKFELAAGGTLFLDEIGDMPLDQQVSLLRVLEDKAVTRIGGQRLQVLDVRIICATNRDLLQEVGKGSFRQDLYYRLNVIVIALPPLREHREDIPMLFRTFHERICRTLGVPLAPVEPDVLERLQSYDWPGNVREFQNAVERMVGISFQGPIQASSLPDEILRPIRSGPNHGTESGQAASLGEHRARIKQRQVDQERQQILALMAEHHGNLTRTAHIMGISRSSIYRKLRG
jgi:transcriptional regulator of acetoin/glycerol metabolism